MLSSVLKPLLLVCLPGFIVMGRVGFSKLFFRFKYIHSPSFVHPSLKVRLRFASGYLCILSELVEGLGKFI